MKTRLFLLLGCLALFLAGCNLTSESNYSPDISFYKNPINNGKDTLSIYQTDENNVYRLDTIRVGDTVSFKMYYYAYSNHLTAIYLAQSADSVTKIVWPRKTSMDSVFLSTSDYDKGKFLMAGTSNELYFPFKYIARKASLEAKITFSVVSDANFKSSSGSNSFTFVLRTPVIAKKE